MNNATDQFIHYQNVKNYSAQLLATQGEAQRATLLKLLAEELAHARQRGWQPPPGSLETRRLHGLE